MNLRLRPVFQNDWKFILKLRNQDSVRTACHDTSIIDLESHIAYMKKLEKDSDSHHWIIVCDDYDVGYIKIVKGEYGYMLKDEYMGKGLGKKHFELVFEKAASLNIPKLTGTIRLEQSIPLKMALKAGFIKKGIIYKEEKPYAYYLEKFLN